MSPLAVVAIGVIGGLGAICRLLADGAISTRFATGFPVGTFVVNLSGAFALGMLVGLTSDQQALALVATGFLGSFTTFSTWMLESERLTEEGRTPIAVANLVAGLLLGVALAWIGTKIGGAL